MEASWDSNARGVFDSYHAVFSSDECQLVVDGERTATAASLCKCAPALLSDSWIDFL
jgi:hypothetical protein